MNNFVFCKYFPGDSIIHKLDSRLKIVSSALFFALTFSLSNIISLAFLTVVMVFVTILSKIPLKKYLKGLKSIFIISIITASINLFFDLETNLICLGKISIPNISNSISVFFRLFILALINSVVIFTTSPQEISAAFESLLAPLKYIGLNSQEISMTITLSLRFIPVLLEETSKIITAQKLRGAHFKNKNIIKKVKAFSNVLIPLFIFSFRRATNIALAMDSRCYDPYKKRTSFKNMKLKRCDIICATILTIIFIGVLICNKIKIL